MQIRHEEETFGDYSIKLGGLPFRTTEREIIDWFSPKAKCARVKILKDNNRPNGRAIAEFVSKNDGLGANQKEGRNLQKCFRTLLHLFRPSNHSFKIITSCC